MWWESYRIQFYKTHEKEYYHMGIDIFSAHRKWGQHPIRRWEAPDMFKDGEDSHERLQRGFGSAVVFSR